MTILEQIEQNPLLLDSEEVRAQVRNFPELDYNKAWDLYLRSKAHQTKAAKVLKTDPPGPVFLLPGLVVLLLAMSVVCFAVSEWGWRASIRRYTSASSARPSRGLT